MKNWINTTIKYRFYAIEGSERKLHKIETHIKQKSKLRVLLLLGLNFFA